MLTKSRALAAFLFLVAPSVLCAAQTPTAAVPASGNTGSTGNFSTTLTTTPSLVFPDPTLSPAAGGQSARHWQRLVVKTGGTVGATIYCSRFTSNPSATETSSFQLAPYGNSSGIPTAEEFAPPVLPPPFPLWCVASSGTIPISAEAY